MKTNKFLKLSTVLLLATAITNSVQAASLFSTEKGKEKVVIGLRGGINWSKWNGNHLFTVDNVFEGKIGNEKNYRSKHNYSIGEYVGINVDIPIVRSMHINTGLFWMAKNNKVSYEAVTYIRYTDYLDKYKAYDIFERNTKIEGKYLEIPILFSYRPVMDGPICLQIDLGPYFAYGIKAKEKEFAQLIDKNLLDCKDINVHGPFENNTPSIYKMEMNLNLLENNNSKELGDDVVKKWNYMYEKEYLENRELLNQLPIVPAQVKRFDMGIHVGVGATIYKHFYVGAFYEHGLTNMLKKIEGLNEQYNSLSKNLSLHTNTFNLSVGVNF